MQKQKYNRKNQTAKGAKKNNKLPQRSPRMQRSEKIFERFFSARLPQAGALCVLPVLCNGIR